MSTSRRQTPAPARKPAFPPSASFFKDPLRLQTIVVPLDLSPESLRALEFAWPLAHRLGARVHVVHVYEGAHQFSSVTTSPVLWSEAEAKRHLADEVELAFGTSPRREDCHLRSGKPVAFTADPAHQSQTTVGGGAGIRLGKPRAGGNNAGMKEVHQQRPIVCGTDFSAMATEAAEIAGEMAQRLGTRLVLVHVEEFSGMAEVDPALFGEALAG